MEIPSKKQLGEVVLAGMINQLRPDKELYSGRKFFQCLLESAGAEGVQSFIEKASRALSDKGELDLHFDFDSVELEAFNRARVQFMSRRGFLGVFAAGASGAAFGVGGGLGILRQTSDMINRSPARETAARNPWSTIEDSFHKNITPYAELLIGGVLINEALEKNLEIKMEQIADAVAQLLETLNKARIEDRQRMAR